MIIFLSIALIFVSLWLLGVVSTTVMEVLFSIAMTISVMAVAYKVSLMRLSV